MWNDPISPWSPEKKRPGFIYSSSARDNITTVNVRHLRDGEHAQLVLRRHWIVYVFLFVWFVAPVVFTIVVFSWWGAIAGIIGSALLGLLLVSVWMIFLLVLYILWINQELDLFVITTGRIIGIEQLSFLNRTVSECNLDEVQEVNAQANGLLANLLNYGTVYISTASERSDFCVNLTPDALVNARHILNVIDTHRYRAHGTPSAIGDDPVGK